MAEQADAVAFSCYIWNIESSLKLADDIKKIAPDTRIILGGPEASFGIFQLMHDNPAVDFVVRGEGEAVFRCLMETLPRQRGSDRSNGTDPFQGIGNLFYRRGAATSSPARWPRTTWRWTASPPSGPAWWSCQNR